jgi:hypothetical protein
MVSQTESTLCRFLISGARQKALLKTPSTHGIINDFRRFVKRKRVIAGIYNGAQFSVGVCLGYLVE